jgi:cysteinyl-tRNA synthetase
MSIVNIAPKINFPPEINFFNSLSRKKENLTTSKPGHLKMYVCGPTVYDRPHLGNARSVVIYDLMFRFFRQAFAKVTYVRNITDIDDKINAAARENKISIQNLTARITGFFYQDMDALNVLRPTHEPRATAHISEMISMIEKLLQNKCAYIKDGHVLFDVTSYKDYGRLSNRNPGDMIAGARVEVAAYKKNPLDFVLWKPADMQDDLSGIFESPWGRGRPGWHIECSAMSSKYLGSDFDIHGGGADLQFPHHENEIAQSRCANPGSNYAHFWIHNGFLTVNGEKMSKSLKNFITVRDLLDKKIPGVVIRYLLLLTHYRKPFDFNQKALDDAARAIEKFYALITIVAAPKIQEKIPERIPEKIPERIPEKMLPQASESDIFFKNSWFAQIISYLADDLNISKVISFLHEKAKEIKTDQNLNLRRQFMEILDFLGLLDLDLLAGRQNKNAPDKNVRDKNATNTNAPDKNATNTNAGSQNTGNENISDADITDVNLINSQINLRLQAKKEKNFTKADAIRQNLLAQGIILEDIAGGKTLWKKK